jgi:glycosyltransferase involved in cell wall biosynthesis
MRRQHTTPNAYPARLLDEYLAVLRRESPDGPGAAALHARSPDARALLAHAAGDATVDELIAAAHNGAAAPGLEPYALGELARAVALQDLCPDDRPDGLALFELLLRTYGADRVEPGHRGLHAQLAFAAGDRVRAAELVGLYRELPEPVRTSLAVDLANPAGAGWLAAFNRLLPGPALRLVDGPEPAFDRIRSGTAQKVGARTRVSTIVTTYRPGPGLLTTVRSLAAQSWSNQEILVVDDGSESGHDEVLGQAAALDPRVRVLRMPVNGGTYRARNAGLDAATGDFVTFQDSDDWSHPLRLERQVAPLLAEPALFATTSVGMRVTEELIVTRPGWAQTRSYNLSSVLFRRAAAVERLGYLDTVRKGADAEYVERARTVFGRPAVRHLTGAPLALIRLSSTSLSGPDTAFGWLHPARHAYLSAFQAWHAEVAAGDAVAVRPRFPRSRAFAAPRQLSGDLAETGYDVVLAGDWTPAGDAATAAAGQARALVARGRKVALLHVDVLPHLAPRPQNLDPAVQALINAGTVDQVVLSDAVRAGLVIVRTPAVLHFAPGIASAITADRVVIEVDAARRRLTADVCVAASRRLFGVEPQWSPSGPADRRRLGAGPIGAALTTVDLPGTVDVRQWGLDRPGLRSDRPIVGCRCAGGRSQWRRLAEVLPDSGRMDIRLWDTGGDARAAFGYRPPRTWLIYGPADTDQRGFLHQLDFYLHFPSDEASRDADPDLLTALAAGCVLVLPHRFAPTFGEAALYCEAADVERTVRQMRHRSLFLRQSERGREFVRRLYGHERYADSVHALFA